MGASNYRWKEELVRILTPASKFERISFVSVSPPKRTLSNEPQLCCWKYCVSVDENGSFSRMFNLLHDAHFNVLLKTEI